MDIARTLGYGRNGHCGDVHSWSASGKCVRCGEAAPRSRYEERRVIRMQPNTVFDAEHKHMGRSYRCSVDTGRKVIFWIDNDVVGEAFWEEGLFQRMRQEEQPIWNRLTSDIVAQLQSDVRGQIDKKVFGF